MSVIWTQVQSLPFTLVTVCTADLFHNNNASLVRVLGALTIPPSLTGLGFSLKGIQIEQGQMLPSKRVSVQVGSMACEHLFLHPQPSLRI